MNSWDDFTGLNEGYARELYENYRRNPESVDAATRAFFERSGPPPDGAAGMAVAAAPSTVDIDKVDKIIGAVNYAQAIRNYGHLSARLDPLGSPPTGDPILNPGAHGLTEDDLRRLPAYLVGGPIAEAAANALDAIRALRAVYTSTIGYDTNHIRVPEERSWLREAAERGTFRVAVKSIDGRALLERLTRVEGFERFLHRIFPGKHRFSIEGLDMTVPMLDEMIGASAEEGIDFVLIGMAHRGRLNVLAHVLNKPYLQILAEFKDPVAPRKSRDDDQGWTGDVKYHLGARRAVESSDPVKLLITIAPNPSHLELVDPVVAGMARAAGTRADQSGAPEFDPALTLPILIHGDASFPGQGIVAETLNLSRLPGYWTGGTIHLITNNQLGYTTLPVDARSTLYASDLAKGFEIPIVHVNADDPEACVEAARLAFAYRAKFQKDFLIDLVGYRRWGHNEGDDPSSTQPTMYRIVQNHPTVREHWANILRERGAIGEKDADEMVRRQMEELQVVYQTLVPEKHLFEPQPEAPPPGAARRVKTSLPMKNLQAINAALRTVPPDFKVHPKLEKAIQRRRENLNNVEDPVIDWATAEELAFASILADGIPIRFTGQDAERGTFNQRHAVLFDYETGTPYIPLQTLPQARAAFEIHNSPLSENAVLGFEYGYNVQEPGRLVLWEAQYGDFNNGAQPVIDEFIASARDKWGQTPSLVLLLPHGLEGAGPDHASARLERFLRLAADTNLRIVNCTTAAQFFHLLRRQALLLQEDPLPLVVMTPKGLLRHPKVASSLRDLAEGIWHPVIDDERAAANRDKIRRLVLCSGKLYVDLITSKRWEEHPPVAVVRVEQLYPFPEVDLEPILDSYTAIEEVVWAQEEPANMGAWEFVQPLLTRVINGRWPLHYLGRPRRSSPAEGSSAWHVHTQERLIEQILTVETTPAKTSKKRVALEKK